LEEGLRKTMRDCRSKKKKKPACKKKENSRMPLRRGEKGKGSPSVPKNGRGRKVVREKEETL